MWWERTAVPRNQLRRISDRVKAWMTFLLVMTMVLAGPWGGWSAAHATYRHDLRSGAWEREHRFPVAAVLQQDPVARVSGTGARRPASPPARTAARCTGPDGSVHIATVVAELRSWQAEWLVVGPQRSHR
jgi:hypothetical protein